MINTTKIPKIIGVYKITSPTNKIYIGQSDHIIRRWGYYKRLASNIKQQIGIYRSLLKYGPENHIFEVIEECTFDELNTRERYWQDYYNVLEKGLNCILVKTKDKPLINSEETKLRKSLAAPTRPIKQYSLDGLFLKDWDRIIDVERSLGIANQTITANCYGRKDSAGGYIWRFKESNIPVIPIKSSKYGICILQYDLYGNFIKEWPSISQASKKLNIFNQCITECCNKTQPQAGGFQFIFKENTIPTKLENINKILQLDLRDNIIKEWYSIADAKRWLGKGDIMGCIHGKHKQSGGYKWKYK